jgi:hypothetical protein
MGAFRTRLSSAGFANVHFDPSENDFVFAIGETQIEYHCAVACFFSPNLAQRILFDPTAICHSVSSTKDADLFRSFLSFASGSELIVTSDNERGLAQLCRELGNSEVF